MGTQPDSGGRPHISNYVIDSTADYLVQIGVLQGDFNLSLHLAAPQPEPPLAAAERRLARALVHQWRAEARAWHLADPGPLPVRWSPSRRVESGGPAVWTVTGRGTVADAFLGLGPRRRRLVVLGTAGSGKTVLAVLFTLDLLVRRLRDEEVPVPLLMSLESWDTERLSLAAWLEERLRCDHPGLPFVDGEHPARLLVRERRVLPVLDGLDELPPRRRAAVLTRLAQDLDGDDDAVLVSRTDEYTAALRGDGPALPGAAVIESLPLRPADTAAHLRRVALDTGRRHAWAPVADALVRSPDGPLAQALTSPLMVWLARRAYERAPADPGELAAAGRFPDRQAVETHLLDRMVPAAFPAGPPDPALLHPPRTWDPARARVWLTQLARLMDQRDESEFAWWRLFAAPRPRLLALPVLIAAGILVSLAVRALLADRGVLGAQSVTNWVMGGVVHATIARALSVHWFRYRLGEPRRRANPLLFLAALRSAERHSGAAPLTRLAVLTGAPALAALLLALYLFATPDPTLVLLSVGGIVPAVLMVLYAAPADTVDAATPEELLAGERQTLLSTLTVVAPCVGLGTGAFFALSGGDGWAPGIGSWLGASATLLLLSPWSRWVLAKSSFALTGRLPWSLMGFLRDARRAGLVRRAGGTYRFRNRRIQEYLAGAAPAAAPAPPDATAGPVPLASGPFTHERGEHRYRLAGRSRRLVLAHWTVLGTLTAVHAVRLTVSGQWQDPPAWISLVAWPLLGALITLVGFALPPRAVELELTREGVRARTGHRRCFYAWPHVEEITARRVVVRGLDARFHALQVRLTDGAPLPGLRHRLGDGWFLVLPLGPTPHVDPGLAAALADFAGPRWRPAPSR